MILEIDWLAAKVTKCFVKVEQHEAIEEYFALFTPQIITLGEATGS